MRRVGEDAERVVVDHRDDLLDGRDVLLPLAGGEVPEDGEHPQADQRPGRDGVQIDRLREAEQRVGAVDLEAGEQQEDDQRGLATSARSARSA